jgi:excisionase family DNA binding protein
MVSMEDAARALRISKSHGYQLVRDGEFPCRVVRLGGSVRVVTASLIALLEGRDEHADGK